MQNAIQFVCGKKDTFTPAQDQTYWSWWEGWGTRMGEENGGGEVDRKEKRKGLVGVDIDG